VTRLRDVESGIRIPAEARDVSLLVNVHPDSGAHTISYSERNGETLKGIKRVGRESDH
jgi:hypothetical protein